MASGKSYHLTSSRKVIPLITLPCCSSTNPREWSFASLYRKEGFDERLGSHSASESCANAPGLEARMPGLQNSLRGERRICLLDPLACRKRTRRAGTQGWLPLLR